MKRIIKISTTVLVMTLIALPAFSQPRNGDRDGNRDRNKGREMFREIPPEVRTEAQLAVFDEYLELSDSQEGDIKEISAVFALRGEELKEEKVNRRTKRMKANELRNERLVAIHDILTKEQYSTYLQNKEAIQYDIRQRLKDHVQDGK